MGEFFTKKYEYQASESAPINLPMEILAGSLIYHDGSGSLYVPSHVIIANGWGDWRSSHVLTNSNHPLPNRLDLYFYSYTEDQFYQGSFDLPFERIKALFEKGYYSRSEGQILKHNLFTIGIAPGGVVSLWIDGFESRIEVFFGYADKVEGEWSSILDNTDIDRKQYIQEVIEDEARTPEALEELKQIGIPFGRWEKYHKNRYSWKPVLNGMKLRDDIISHIHFYNGEENYLNVPFEDDSLSSGLAVPDQLTLIWNRTGFLVNDMMIEAFFDETEIFDSFKKLSQNRDTIEMEFRMEPEKNYDFTIWLKNTKHSIELKKTRIETWKPGGLRYENASPTDKE